MQVSSAGGSGLGSCAWLVIVASAGVREADARPGGNAPTGRENSLGSTLTSEGVRRCGIVALAGARPCGQHEPW